MTDNILDKVIRAEYNANPANCDYGIIVGVATVAVAEHGAHAVAVALLEIHALRHKWQNYTNIAWHLDAVRNAVRAIQFPRGM